MTAVAALRRWHRRLSLVVGLQLLAWTVSGLVFSWDPIEVVRGETSLRETPPPPPASLDALRPPGEVAAALGLTSLDEARLAHHRGRWTWSLSGPGRDGPVLADARDGTELPELDASAAGALAAARLVFAAGVAEVSRVERAEGEYRGKPVPAWRVRFDDPQEHHLYLAPRTGEVLAVRHDTWRRFDLLWMLHIMDYTEREDFSTPWLTLVAALGVLSAGSGLALGLAVSRPARLSRRA